MLLLFGGYSFVDQSMRETSKELARQERWIGLEPEEDRNGIHSLIHRRDALHAKLFPVAPAP